MASARSATKSSSNSRQMMVWGPSALPTNFIDNLSTRMIAGHRAMSGRPRRTLSRSGCYASGSVYLLPVWALTAPLAQ